MSIWRAWKKRVWVPVLRRFHPEVEAQIDNRRLRVDLRDEIIGTLLYLDHEYESEIQRLMHCMDLQGAVCLDIGANIGLHTLVMSELADRVFAFEPQSRNFELLEKNLRSNGVSNVVAKRAAVGSREGTCRLAVHANNFGDHRVAAGNSGSEQVSMVTIDSVVRDVRDNSIGLIKIDVQGYETQVLRGMRETLRRNPGVILIIEVFPEGLQAAGSSASELVGALRDEGFDGWEFHDFRLIPCQEPYVYDLIRGGKYQDLVLSRRGERITQVLERLYSLKMAQTFSLC